MIHDIIIKQVGIRFHKYRFQEKVYLKKNKLTVE